MEVWDARSPPCGTARKGRVRSASFGNPCPVDSNLYYLNMVFPEGFFVPLNMTVFLLPFQNLLRKHLNCSLEVKPLWVLTQLHSRTLSITINCCFMLLLFQCSRLSSYFFVSFYFFWVLHMLGAIYLCNGLPMVRNLTNEFCA